MTDLVKLSGSKQLLGDLEETNPLVFGDIELGMLYWYQVLQRIPDLTMGDIKNIRMAKKDITVLGAKWYERAWDGLTDTVGDVANWVADKSGDATRLIFLEESEGGSTAVGGILDVAASFLTSGTSTVLKDIPKGENGALLDQFLGFFRGTGEKVRDDIIKAGIDLPTGDEPTGEEWWKNLEPKHYLYIGGGILGTVLLVMIGVSAAKK